MEKNCTQIPFLLFLAVFVLCHVFDGVRSVFRYMQYNRAAMTKFLLTVSETIAMPNSTPIYWPTLDLSSKRSSSKSIKLLRSKLVLHINVMWVPHELQEG